MQYAAHVVRCALLVALCSCANDPDPYVVPEGCNPLAADWDCMLPFPSDRFLVDDPSLPSGHRVDLPLAARVPFGAEPLDAFADRAIDGFSPATPILAYFPVALDAEPLVRWDEDVTATQRGEGPTVIVDAASGELVPHFAELDASSADPLRRVLILRPLVRLAAETRYVVGLRDLVDEDGAPAPAPEGFRRLRDGDENEGELARYEDAIFPVLEDAGFARDTLQLAWDFTTASEERLTGDMLAARAIAIDALAAAPPAVRVLRVIEGDALAENLRGSTARQIEIEVDAPRIVTSATAGEGYLLRDDEGRVRTEGTVTFAATILVPQSVADAGTPARLLQYGHGFFGSRGEMTGGYVDDFANEHGFVAMAADWWGMMFEDRNEVAGDLAAGRARELLAFIERTHQGMVNFIVLAGAAEVIAALPELAATEGGSSLVDPSDVFFWGNSQGHILGGVYTAISPHVRRSVLGVGGANFSLIMFRSRAFAALRALLELNIEGPLETQQVALLLQHWLDRIDPVNYARFVSREPLEGAPEKQVLLHTGPGDEAVTHLAAELHARELGIPLLTPSPFTPPLLQTATAPVPSALVELDYLDELGIEIVPTAQIPDEANAIHESIRRNPRVQEQVDAFLRADGVVTHTCDGPCDPE
ncbi:hypothetical protein [Sandaracinus amylolyticus]|uniref:Uncharacterized protein n=1 Tax=Sandaracinus amylolyticus TaxID=927083 RepID=A0A0F6W5L3_9BACT|nr:hypothetical protein [Sandaracinus amylolyticus]AKF07896.1 hypothetical protein DB32_005045 [Sandaracinus amylolyticus]